MKKGTFLLPGGKSSFTGGNCSVVYGPTDELACVTSKPLFVDSAGTVYFLLLSANWASSFCFCCCSLSSCSCFCCSCASCCSAEAIAEESDVRAGPVADWRLSPKLIVPDKVLPLVGRWAAAPTMCRNYPLQLRILSSVLTIMIDWIYQGKIHACTVELLQFFKYIWSKAVYVDKKIDTNGRYTSEQLRASNSFCCEVCEASF